MREIGLKTISAPMIYVKGHSEGNVSRQHRREERVWDEISRHIWCLCPLKTSFAKERGVNEGNVSGTEIYVDLHDECSRNWSRDLYDICEIIKKCLVKITLKIQRNILPFSMKLKATK